MQVVIVSCSTSLNCHGGDVIVFHMLCFTEVYKTESVSARGHDNRRK